MKAKASKSSEYTTRLIILTEEIHQCNWRVESFFKKFTPTFQFFWKAIWQHLLETLKIFILFDREIAILDIYTKKISKIQTQVNPQDIHCSID